MTKKLVIALLTLAVTAVSVAAQQSAEEEIRRAALNYAEGWYEGDAAKMESSLHPDLAKRRIETNAEGRSRVAELSSLGLVQMTRPGYGKNTPKAEQVKDVKVLDVFGDIATVRLEIQLSHVLKIHAEKTGDKGQGHEDGCYKCQPSHGGVGLV